MESSNCWTIVAATHAAQGSRSTMEDVSTMILQGRRTSTPPLKRTFSGEEENRPTKRLKVLSGTSREEEESQFIKSVGTKLNEVDASLFIVCDGHGGVQAAEYVNEHLFNNITSQPDYPQKAMEAIVKGFHDTEQGFLSVVKEKDLDGIIGTTVTAALLIENTLYVANVGDSEAVLCLDAQPDENKESSKKPVKNQVVTQCHTGNNSTERQRVKEEGGLMISDRRGAFRLAHPVWNPHLVNIGITRSIGDFYFKDPEILKSKCSGLIATPNVTKVELSGNEKFLIIASDGFWDVVEFKVAVEYVNNQLGKLECSQICHNLVELALLSKAIDNVTVLLVMFQSAPKSEPTPTSEPS